MAAHDVVVLSAVRTAIGKFGGSLKDIPPTELAAQVICNGVQRAGLAPADIGHVVFGNAIHTDAKDMYLAGVASTRSGIPAEVPTFTLSRRCGSGLQPIFNAVDAISRGDAIAAVSGGVGSMSRSPYWIPTTRRGTRHKNASAVDLLLAALTDASEEILMGTTFESVARRWHVSRDEQDDLALDSHRRAVTAILLGRFREQIVPIQVETSDGPSHFLIDESPCVDASLAYLAGLRPAFDAHGTVTAGNACSISDGAAAVVLMNGYQARKRGLQPLARVVDYAVSGVESCAQGVATVYAVRRLFESKRFRKEDIDVFEVSEAFAVQIIAVCRELDLPPEKTNPNGNGISLGYPIGATGAIAVVKAIHELNRIGGRYALVSMGIGGGQGLAVVLESMTANVHCDS